MNTYNLSTERLLIKPITQNDLNYVHTLHSLPEVDQFNTLGIPENIRDTSAILDKWITENSLKNTRSFTFTIGLQTCQKCIGIIGITLGKPKYNNAEIWFKFHPAYWNKGYATEAVNAILEFGFNTLQLHRIEAGSATGNIGSIKVLEKAGMIREAHTRQLLPLQSGWSDNYGYAKLATD